MNEKLIGVLSLAVIYAGLTGCGMKHTPAANSFQAPRSAAASTPSKKDIDCRVVSFKTDVLPALQESCLACHYSKSQMPGLDLSTANAYSDLVNRKSSLDAHLVLVKPSAVADSFLVEKLSPKPRYGASMPPYARPLSPAEKNLLTQWIQQGAKDN
ncbi:MAG TPA: hypothetical protein VG675_06620 [Bryobacteraceae bacterium]|nr:hypothetical protein [Bryobacteraceae bacterium]